MKAQNGNWNGGKTGYVGIHQYIRRYKPKPDYCTICNEKKKRLELASIDHKYTRNIDDYLYLCPSCHPLFDKMKRNQKVRGDIIS